MQHSKKHTELIKPGLLFRHFFELSEDWILVLIKRDLMACAISWPFVVATHTLSEKKTSDSEPVHLWPISGRKEQNKKYRTQALLLAL
jgi:hypothetical protein